MTDHAEVGNEATDKVAGAVRAELARHKKTAADLAAALGMTQHTVGKRLGGKVAFDVKELAAISAWLDVPLSRLWAGVETVQAAS